MKGKGRNERGDEEARDVAAESGAEDVEPEREAAEEVERDLENLLEDVKRERDDYLELAQRTKADFDNYRKRIARDVENGEGRGESRVVRELMPVVDNLERALAAAEPRDRDHPESHISEGIRLVHEEICGVLKRVGVEAFEPDGEQFDPNMHEAIMTRPDEGAEPGTVIEVLRKGYKREEQVLRPAQVVVSSAPESE